MFVAAVVSGTPSVLNGFPVAVAFIVAVGVGIAWVRKQARKETPDLRFGLVIGRANSILAVGTLSLGVITALSSLV